MKKVYYSFLMPSSGYVGGVATVLNCYFDHSDEFKEEGIDIELLQCSDKAMRNCPIPVVRQFLYGWSQYKAASKIIGNNDIFHIHTSRSFLYLKDIVLGRKLKRDKGVKTVLTIHVGKLETVNEKLPFFLQRLALKWLEKYFDKIIFLREGMKEQFVQNGISEEKSEVLYNFHDLNVPFLKNRETKTDIRLLFVGMINRNKGILEILKAIVTYPELPIKLDICGTITEEEIREDYQQLIKLSRDKVVVHGYVKGKEKIDIYNQSDILVLPSHHEGLPLVIMEALGVGDAIIATPVGAIPEVLSEKNVQWVKPGNVESIAEAIRFFIDSPEKLISMQYENYELGKNYHIKAHIQKLADIYNSL